MGDNWTSDTGVSALYADSTDSLVRPGDSQEDKGKMDAVKFIKEKDRMCKTLPDCIGCPVKYICNPNADEAKAAVAAVEKWREEHPVVTNGQKVQELIPYTALLRSWASAIGNEPLDDSDVVKLVIPRDWWDAEYKEENND